jgi:uncharacterized protein
MQAHADSFSTARVVRRHEYKAMPWRNGGGTTYEIACEPEGAARFEWRLSLALIEQGGPFSNFAGYARAISLVGGAGCILHGIDPAPVRLDAPGVTKLFPGAASVTCELIAGPCHDLNLMVREPGEIASARHLRLDSAAIQCASQRNNTVFCLEGALECVSKSGERLSLAKHDTFIVPAPAAADWRFQAGGTGGAEAITHAWFTSG